MQVGKLRCEASDSCKTETSANFAQHSSSTIQYGCGNAKKFINPLSNSHYIQLHPKLPSPDSPETKLLSKTSNPRAKRYWSARKNIKHDISETTLSEEFDTRPCAEASFNQTPYNKAFSMGHISPVWGKDVNRYCQI